MNEAPSGLVLCQEFSLSSQTPPPIPPPVVFRTPPPLPPPIMATAVGECYTAMSAVPPHLNGRALEPMDAYRPPREMWPEPRGTARLPRAAFAASMLLMLGLGLWTRWLIDDSTARLEQASLAMQSPIVIYRPVTNDDLPLTERVSDTVALPSMDLASDDATSHEEATEPAVASPRIAALVEVASVDQSEPADTPADTTVQFVSTAIPSGANPTTDTVANDVPSAMPPVCDAEVCQPQRKLDTALVWAESINEAAALANEENKLVFLIHVSGNFEIQEFT